MTHIFTSLCYVNFFALTSLSFIHDNKTQVVAYDFNLDSTRKPKDAAFFSEIALNGRFLKEGFESEGRPFTSRFFCTMYQKVFFSGRLTVEETCPVSMTLLTVGLLHLLCKKSTYFEPVDKNEINAKKGYRKQRFCFRL
ncbi:unnamed protein product [Mucor fragilis]